jgi:hypothetical protein
MEKKENETRPFLLGRLKGRKSFQRLGLYGRDIFRWI